MRTQTPPELLGLLSDPLRWSILHGLSLSDLRAGEIVEFTGRPQNLVSYHLAKLVRSGLVEKSQSSHDGRDHYFHFNRQVLTQRLGEIPQLLGSTLAISQRSRVTSPRRVLFVCTGNSIRSQMAEAFATHHAGHAVKAKSAGTMPTALNPLAVEILAERGIDISRHTSKPFSLFVNQTFDSVITLCDRAREVVPPFGHSSRYIHWSVSDPALSGRSMAEQRRILRRVADDIDVRVVDLLTDLHLAPLERRTHV